METLKRSAIRPGIPRQGHHRMSAISPGFRPVLSLILVALLIPAFLSAQTDQAAIRTAFENSYTFESNAEYKKAIKCITDVYAESSYEMNLRLGWLSYQAGLHLESTTYYQKAIKLKPYAVEPKFGFVYPAAALGNWSQVVAQYQEILRIDPQNSVANYRMGLISYNRKDYLTAVKYLEKVVNLYPFDYDGNLLFGWICLKLARYREAQVLFNKVLLIKPDDKSALEGLSLIK